MWGGGGGAGVGGPGRDRGEPHALFSRQAQLIRSDFNVNRSCVYAEHEEKAFKRVRVSSNEVGTLLRNSRRREQTVAEHGRQPAAPAM